MTHQIIIKQTPNTPNTKYINLNLHFTKNTTHTTTSTQTSPNFQKQLSSLKTIYSQIKIKIHNMTYHNITVTLSSLHINQIKNLLSQNTNKKNTTPIFFINKLLTNNNTLQNLTSIPKPYDTNTQNNYIITLTTQPNNTSNTLTNIITHKLNHYLKLFHTTKKTTLTIHNPLPNTPQKLKNNLITLFLNTTTLTTTQNNIIQLHPIIQHNYSQNN